MKNITDIDYEELVQGALLQVVRQTLELTAKEGAIGDHHFYISFATDHPSVVIPDYLREEYPDEITIVLQHEFWDLKVEAQKFSVTLCFNDANEHILVPYDAITSFVDPSVKFGLQFTPSYEPIHEETPPPTKDKAKKGKKGDKKNSASDADGSNVVTLDAFRKK
jgi:hypothetical protein